MSDMPETIWAMAPYIGEYLADPPVTPEDHLYLTEYRRNDKPATNAQIKANTKVQALVEVLEQAEIMLRERGYWAIANEARAALAALEAETSVNWRDDPAAIVEDDEPQIGRDYE